MLPSRKKHFVTFMLHLTNELKRASLFSLTGLILNFSLFTAAGAEVKRFYETDLGNKHYKYMYEWSNPQVKPRAIMLAIHGLTLHGLVYDSLARHLADEGFIVIAPDLPGYGRDKYECISYSQAKKNLIEIIGSAKSTYRDLPLICIGESMGADLALQLAESKPDLVNGVILSNPALKPRQNLSPRAIRDRMSLLVGLIDNDVKVDLSPYIEDYVSDDPQTTQAVLTDPLVRKRLSFHELWDNYRAMRPTCKKARLVDKKTPVLIMQGSNDKILETKAIVNLLANLHSNDQTMRWFDDRGHLMIEACEPKSEILQTVDDWLALHINELEARQLGAQTSSDIAVTSALPTTNPSLLEARSD